MDYGKGSIAFGVAAGVAIYTALMTGGYKPILLVASFMVIINISLGGLVSSIWRRYRILAFINFYACFVPLTIAMAHGGEFKPELVKNIYQALAG